MRLGIAQPVDTAIDLPKTLHALIGRWIATRVILFRTVPVGRALAALPVYRIAESVSARVGTVRVLATGCADAARSAIRRA